LIYKIIFKKEIGIYKEKGSVFHSIAMPIDSLNDMKYNLKIIKDEYFNSNHVCYAYRLFINEHIDEYFSDGGEPKGSAGQPILNVLKKNNLINSIIFVVRYFGGAKLGMPGLSNAYGYSAKNSIKNIQLNIWHLKKQVSLTFPYEFEGLLMFVINAFNAKIITKDFKEDIQILIEIGEGQYGEFIRKIRSISFDKINFKDI